jgi:redox-sensitive bicupin YhaK (pirin superfamily)
LRTHVVAMNKTLLATRPGPAGHWVGDGFPVRSLFTYQDAPAEFSPFLLLDHAGPAHFEPTSARRGVGTHPHRGFETVTIVYAGEVEHRDSAGHGGTIGPGDVQWMTAGGGILHEEFHSREFARRGGELEMAQLWVDLPARDKLTPPRYQTIAAARIPSIELERGRTPSGATGAGATGSGGTVRIIAGTLGGVRGPAATFSELNVWDVRLAARASSVLEVPEGHNTLLIVLRGSVRIGGAEPLTRDGVAVLSRAGRAVDIEGGAEGAGVLLLSGVPLEQPVVGYGPFVMGSVAEIKEAMADLQAGRFGQMTAGELEVSAHPE